MFTKIYDFLKRFIKYNYKFILFWVMIIFIAFYKLPYVVYSPGGVIDLSSRIQIEGGYDSTGKLEMSYVTMRKGTIPSILLSYIIPNWDIEKEENITLEGQTLNDTLKVDRLRMQEAIDSATILAYKMANKKIDIIKEIANIVYIDQQAKTNLQLLDKIISIDNQNINNLQDIKNIIEKHQVGDIITFSIERDQKPQTATAEVYQIDGVSKIGISVITEYEYDANPKIDFKSNIGESGPSGGLMMSLAIYNTLISNDLTKGKTIAGTGTIDLDGNVGRIDGVKYKLLGAKKNGANIFICPIENEEEALNFKNSQDIDIIIVGVRTFSEAIDYLNNIE